MFEPLGKKLFFADTPFGQTRLLDRHRLLAFGFLTF